MEIEKAKSDLIQTLSSIDKEKLSLPDLKLYAETLKIVSEIQAKSYAEIMAETFAKGSALGYKPMTVSELK